MSFHGMRPTRQYPVLDKELVTLEVRQQPQQALITSEHKEKTRKAIDPPPIVQIKVDEKRSHDQGNWLVNPFMFMIAVLVEAEPAPQGDPNDPSSTDAWKPVQGNNLLGQTVSSLHRLKDVNNADGGYFVFGDISCKRIGFYRLQFNLFDFQKNSGEAVFVKSTVSEPFQVVSSKEFRGQRESTPLSRTFSDQGVRLRLRKEQRVLQGTKRAYGGSPVASSARAGPYGVYNGVQTDRPYAHPAPKRQKSGYDYNSHVYYPQQVPSNPVYQYNNVLQGNTYGVPSQPQSSHQLDQGTPYPGLMGQGYLQSNSASSWQRPMQQGHVAAPYNGASSSPYLSSMHHAAPTARDGAASAHAQHHGQQAGLRAGDETFSASLGGLHTPSSISETLPTSTSQQQQSFLAARADVQEHESDDGIGGHPSYAVQHHHVGDAHSQMGYRMGVANQPVPSYTSSMQPATSAAYDPQLQESAVARYHDRQFNNAHNLYSDPSRGSLASHGVPLPDDHESLDSGILNRGFVPSYRQQPVGMDHGAAHYKEGYPTPHQQTSPL